MLAVLEIRLEESKAKWYKNIFLTLCRDPLCWGRYLASLRNRNPGRTSSPTGILSAGRGIRAAFSFPENFTENSHFPAKRLH